MSGVVEICGDVAAGNVWSVDELDRVVLGLEKDIWGLGYDFVVEKIFSVEVCGVSLRLAVKIIGR